MEPKFQSSFIPKKPVSSAPQVMSGKPTSNIFYIVSVIIFIIVLALCAGLFAYKKVLVSQIKNADNQITETRKDFAEDTIKKLLGYNDRIVFANRILSNHIVLYPMFTELQNLTLKNISFSNFSYTNKDGIINLSSDVLAKNFNALSQQSLAFSGSKYISNSVFSGFKLTEQGNISAKFTLNLDGALVSYRRNIDTYNTNQ